jgi:hypothetical protein
MDIYIAVIMDKFMNKNDEIIKYLEENKKDSIIFNMALEAIQNYKIPIETMLIHIIKYQHNLLKIKNAQMEMSKSNIFIKKD